jgi:ATPase subunit of ABC transporter with duplicated ATPase domains
MVSSVCLELRAVALQLPCGRALLAPVSLSLDARVVALIGANGVGKSSLCRTLAGLQPPAGGAVLRHAPVRLIDPSAIRAVGGSVLETLSHAMSEPGLWARLAELGLAGLDLSRPISSLSGGEVVRLALAAELSDPCAFLVLDEPGVHLDAKGQAWLMRALALHRGGALLISHSPELLGAAQRVLEFSNGRLHDYAMGYNAYRELRAVERAAEQRAVHEASATLVQQRASAQRARERSEQRASQGRRERARGSQGAMAFDFLQERAESGAGRRLAAAAQREQVLLARAKEQRSRLQQQARFDLRIDGLGPPAGRRLLQARGLRIEVAGEVVLRALDLEVRGPQRLAIVGRNGSGKSLLLNTLAGRMPPAAGTIVGGAQRCVLIDQHATLPAADSLLACIAALQPQSSEAERRERLSWFGFGADQWMTHPKSLSTGERCKLALCAQLDPQRLPDLLLLDEPDSFLDLPGRAAVEHALAQFPGALLVVSHSLEFLRSIGVEDGLRLDGQGGAGRIRIG